MAHAYLNRIKNSRLNKKAKWKAITTVLEPAVLYPLMACSCKDKEMDHLDKTLSKAKCHALGLNEHFPRAVLHGPVSLGGLGIHSGQTKTTTTRINYFLYHTRMDTTIGHKLDASVAFLQMEIGTIRYFLEMPYHMYGFLATHTLMKRIWNETEPHGLILKHAQNIAWTPALQGTSDFSIIEFALSVYSTKIVNKLNRVRLHLQVITFYDLLCYNGTQIHPNFLMGQRIPSRKSTLFWADFPKPPKQYISLWRDFLLTFLTPMLQGKIIKWNTESRPHYNTTYYYSPLDNHLYEKINHTYRCYTPRVYKRSQKTPRFDRSGKTCTPSPDIIESLKEINAIHYKTVIQLHGESNINNHAKPQHYPNVSNFSHLYHQLPIALQRLCGEIKLPEDGGKALIQHLQNTKKPLIGMSDASLKDNQCSHAWILSTGEPDHITYNNMSIQGVGAVDGDLTTMSSTRGELHGQTAMAIISNTLLHSHNASNIKVILHSDNQGV
jgi:hypothetical protein